MTSDPEIHLHCNEDRRRSPVLLLSMPWIAAANPSLQMAVLKSALNHAGISTDLHYPNLVLARILGVKQYEKLVPARKVRLLSEFLFSAEVFEESRDFATVERYLNFLERSDEYRHNTSRASFTRIPTRDHLFRILGKETVGLLRHIREQVVPAYLDLLVKDIGAHDARVVGFTCTFNQVFASAALARRIRQRLPDRVLVLGGANMAGPMGSAYHEAFPWFDHVVSNEADETFPSLVQAVLDGRTAEGIPGVSYRKDGDWVRPGAPPPVRYDDRYPFLDYDEYFDDLQHCELQDHIPPSAVKIPYEAARGCWWGEKHHCTFCGLNDDTLKFRSKSPGRVVDELSHLVDRHGAAYVSVVDEIITPSYLEKMLPELAARRTGLRLYYRTKANLRKVHIRRFAEAGVRETVIGIESLSTRVLKLMRKGTTALQNIQTLKWCTEYGVDVTWNLLYGFPGEEEADYREMLPRLSAMTHLNPPNGMPMRIELYRFSPYHAFPQQFGIRNMRPWKDYEYLYPAGRIDLSRSAYFFDSDPMGLPDENPVVQLMSALVSVWGHRQEDGTPAQLRSHPHADGLHIFDSRPLSGARTFTLRGTLADAYLYCDEIRSRQALVEYIQQTSGGMASDDEIGAVLDSLVDCGLMLREGHRFLSMAIPAPVSADSPPPRSDEHREFSLVAERGCAPLRGVGVR